MSDLSGKTIVITGGAQGIGAASAQLCAARGASVILADIQPERGEAAAEAIRQAGGKAEFSAVDVRDPGQVSAVFEQVREDYGGLDGLVCAAGVLRGAFLSPEELSLEDFQIVQDINVKGVFLCAKYATPLLEASQGVMVVVVSGAGVVGPSSSLAYAASKGGANGLAMTLEAQFQSRGIRLNMLSPGNIVTDMKLSVEIENARRKGIPVETAIAEAREKYGTPEGVARVVAFMVSDDAAYVRGTIFTR